MPKVIKKSRFTPLFEITIYELQGGMVDRVVLKSRRTEDIIFLNDEDSIDFLKTWNDISRNERNDDRWLERVESLCDVFFKKG